MRVRPLVEVCVTSAGGALAAATAGADRLELSSAMELGGLTPSVALIETVLEQVTLPVLVMIRPRAGGFHYEPDQFRTALLDAEWALSLGARGVVFGFLTKDARIDVPRCRELVALAGERQTVFHRAFDFVVDPLAAADQLVELGVTRVLTSGQRPTALEGTGTIRAVVERTRGYLEVLPGGGIRADNVWAVLDQSLCDQVHIGASLPESDGSLAHNSQLDLVRPGCLAPRASYRLDADKVLQLSKVLKSRPPLGRKHAVASHRME